MASFQLSALTGVIGKLDGLLSFSDSLDSVLRVMPRHAMGSFRLSTLTDVFGTFDGPLSFLGSSEFRPPHHAMPHLAMPRCGPAPSHGSPFLPSPMPLISPRPRPRGSVPSSAMLALATLPCCVGWRFTRILVPALAGVIGKF